MAYIVPIHKPSTVRHGIKAKFLHDEEDSLIIARSNKIEVYDIVPDGLQLQTHFTVYGSVTALLSLRPASSPRDHLFIATDRYDYFTVSWDAENGQLRNERKATDVTDRFQRPASSGHLYIADPHGRILGLYLYEGIFTAIPIVPARKDKRRKQENDDPGNLDEPCPIRMNELKVIKIVFLYGTKVPVVAVLFADSKGDVHLKTYEVATMKKGVDDGGLRDWTISANKLDPMSRMLIPVPDPIGGVIVVGEQVLTYLHQDKPSKPLQRALFEAANFSAYGMIDETRYLLGSETGGLFLLLLVVQENEVTSMKIDNLGETSLAKCIVYLDSKFVFVGSHFGDPQLLRINSEVPRLEVVDTLTNLAPISDFAVLGLEVGGDEVHQFSSGQTTILTCSGGFQNGSLKSVRSGVGMEELGILGEMAGVRGLWALRASNGENDDTLILSFVDGTRVMAFGDDGDVEELDGFSQFNLSTTTLVAKNVGHDRLLQVTPTQATLVDKESSVVLGEWSPGAGSKINLASCNDDVLVLIVDGSKLVAFDIKGRAIQDLASHSFDDEVACLTIPSEGSALCVVGFWNSASVAVLAIPSLEVLAKETLSGAEGVIPRSLLLVKLMEGMAPTLFVAMGDGSLFTFALSKADGSLSERKSIVLGTQAINFQAIPKGGGVFSVFATCDHPTMIYGEEGKIVYSAVTADKATFVTSFDAKGFPRSVVVASEQDVRIASVDSSRTSHTRLLPLKQFARRVAIAKKSQLFGIGTITSHIDANTGMEASKCSFKIVDENLMDVIDAVDLKENELVEALICAILPDSDGQPKERFILSTSIGGKSEDAERGRLLIFEFGEDRKLHMILGRDLRAACYSLAVIQGKIVAGLSSSIDVYKFSYPDSLFKPQLQRVASARVASVPISIAVHGSRLFVGDLMKGVQLLEYKPGNKGEDDKLEEIGRQYAISWVTALEALGDDICVSADADTNLIVLERDQNGITEEDRRRMQTVSELRLGEMVNRIRRVNEPTYANAPVSPKAYIATVEGSLYLFGLINSEYLDLLMKFQTNLSRVVKGVANLDFNRFRAFYNKARPAAEPFRFVDGDLIERFLDLTESDVQRVLKGERDSDDLGLSAEELKNIVEGLKRMH